MALHLVTAPELEPVTLEAAKQQVRRTDVDDDDVYLSETLIPAVRERGEQATKRQFISATWDYKLQAFPCDDEAIVLPLPPLQSVTSITYVDENGDTQVWASSNYVVDAPSGPSARRGLVYPAYNVSYPTTRDQRNAVTVRFIAGYGDEPKDVPSRLKMGMLLDLGTLYEHREDQVVGQGYSITSFPVGAAAIYRSFRSW